MRRDDKQETVIRCGDQVLFSELSSWEAIESRYEPICQILKHKYGERLLDVVPTPESEMWLYGDCLSGLMRRKCIRDRVFANQAVDERGGRA
jgi:hypothetical protein